MWQNPETYGKNPIAEGDFQWIFARNCEGTEQLLKFDEITRAINDLQDEFEENDSEIETVARDSIGETAGYILDWFGIDIDAEEAIRERDW